MPRRDGHVPEQEMVNALHLYYKLTHMVDESNDPTIEPPTRGDETEKTDQLDLPLRKVSSR